MPDAALTTPSLAKARRMIAVIDRRIDLVRAQLPILADDASVDEHQRVRNQAPGLQGFERSLFARRGDWQLVRDEHEYRAYRQARAQADREQRAKDRKRCPTCHRTYEAA